MTSPPPVVELTLDQATAGEHRVVKRVIAPADCPQWATWLEEIGFIPGEAVMLMSRTLLRGGPIVVRVGQSTFALRPAEAACVRLESRA